MMWYQLTPVKMVIFKKCTDNKYWQECGEKEILVQCWWKCLYTHTHKHAHNGILPKHKNHSNDRKWRGTKKPLAEGERGKWKNWLKTPHSKTKIMASGPITSWQTDGEKLKQWQTLLS